MSRTTIILCLAFVFVHPTARGNSQFKAEFNTEDDSCYVQTALVLNKLQQFSKKSSEGQASFTSSNHPHLNPRDEKNINAALHIKIDALELKVVQLEEKIKTSTVQLLQEIQTLIKVVKSAQGQCQTADKNVAGHIKKLPTELESPNQEIQDLQGENCKKLSNWSAFDRKNVISSGGKKFFFNITRANMAGSRTWCKQKGMVLPTLKNVDEVKKTSAELTRLKFPANGFWMSASDIGWTLGQFHWTDRTPVDAALWESGQPKDFGAGKNTCVVLRPDLMSFQARSCGFSQHILCEVPQELHSCYLYN